MFSTLRESPFEIAKLLSGESGAAILGSGKDDSKRGENDVAQLLLLLLLLFL